MRPAVVADRAGGVHPSVSGRYLSRLGLSLDDYLLEPMPYMNFDGLVARTPLCTLDKARLIHDLTGSAGLQRRHLGPEEGRRL